VAPPNHSLMSSTSGAMNSSNMAGESMHEKSLCSVTPRRWGHQSDSHPMEPSCPDSRSEIRSNMA